MDQVLGTINVARRLDCSVENVRALERAGKLVAERTPSGRRIFKASVVEKLKAERDEEKQKKSAKSGIGQ